MAQDEVPIQMFVNRRYLSAPVQKIVEGWRVEAQLVIDRLVEHFREMGVYKVTPVNEGVIMKNLLHHLRHSPEITKLVSRARQDEQKRQRNRHAE